MLKQALLSKFKTQELSHFYIVSCPLQEQAAREFLDKWLEDFLVEVLKTKRANQESDKIREGLKLGHADIQFIQTENKTFTLAGGEFDDFFKFLEHTPHELGHKFIIVRDSHKITETLSNKLLKTLEEPPIDITIFFLDPQKKKVLPTISSRAISLNLTIKKNIEHSSFDRPLSFESWVNTVPELELDPNAQALMALESGNGQLHTLVEGIRSKNLDEESIIKLLLQWVSQTRQDGKLSQQLIEGLKEASYQRPFNGPAQGRMIPLLSKIFTL
ncbi:DNA polymerase III, delta subunit [Bacteriovorax sp. DB6_IX]|uniref:DNA polymerase III, delta subunit n=1 Tax=Bacteriovorax sp. DB6_IX TaxID=1353530 RepID=UPI000389F606|nr:DNA polymerase III, delta subunit [Bacteriovorax sp. DB6_IX]EQC49824.1 DNA polymerase III, delta subunit [Bacteriovorax sp. DB6_IX]